MHRPSQPLEDRLKDMMPILSVQHVDMQGYTGMQAEGPEELLAEPGIERPDLLIGQQDMVLQEGPVGYVGDDTDQGLVHRQMAASIAVDAGLAAERPAEGLTETDADIFDGMMVIDFDIALGRYRQVEKAVHGKEGKHVIEERDTGIDRRLAFPVQVENQMYIRLPCLPFDRRRPCPLLLFHVLYP